jgi:FkbM family methyltransferase
MKALLKPAHNLLNRLLGPTGFRLTNLAPRPSEPTLAGMLLRLRARDPQFRTVIDVGASDGHWSRRLAAALPNARNFVLIEAQQVHRAGLDGFVRDYPCTRIVQAAAGGRTGEIYFDADDPWSGLAAESPDVRPGNWIRVPVTTIDAEVAASGFPGPYLVKLDTHGFERPILDGARATLAQTELLIVECYNFDVAPGALRFPEFCQHLATLGFRCIDLFDPGYRPRDGAFWQCDLAFAPADAPAFASAAYH